MKLIGGKHRGDRKKEKKEIDEQKAEKEIDISIVHFKPPEVEKPPAEVEAPISGYLFSFLGKNEGSAPADPVEKPPVPQQLQAPPQDDTGEFKQRTLPSRLIATEFVRRSVAAVQQDSSRYQAGIQEASACLPSISSSPALLASSSFSPLSPLFPRPSFVHISITLPFFKEDARFLWCDGVTATELSSQLAALIFEDIAEGEALDYIGRDRYFYFELYLEGVPLLPSSIIPRPSTGEALQLVARLQPGRMYPGF